VVDLIDRLLTTTELYIKDTKFGGEFVESLAYHISNTSKLGDLRLSKIVASGKALIRNETLKELSL